MSMIKVGIKQAAWSFAERTCPYMKPTKESYMYLKAYSRRHEELKIPVINSLSDILAKYGYTLVAHAGVKTVEPLVYIEASRHGVPEIRMHGSPDIIALFSRDDDHIVATVEVKSTVYSALESASIYQAIVYSYTVFESRFPGSMDSIKQGEGEVAASRRVAPPREPGLILEFYTKAKMQVDSKHLSTLRSKRYRYYGLIAYRERNRVNFVPVLSAERYNNEYRVEVIDGIVDVVSELVYPMIETVKGRSGQMEYRPGAWCRNCRLLDSCTVYSHSPV